MMTSHSHGKVDTPQIVYHQFTPVLANIILTA